MNKLFLLSNAHIDPVWLWQWQEGATATVATFRAAAEICEEFDGFVFCHNEALLYQWVEEYDPALFARIQKLVKAGKWHIMGGCFLQPDCNLPSGESILRQITAGQKYFADKFEKCPTVAINFDTFGHSRGMVQILSQCGYKGYIFMRPGKHQLTLPANSFTWEGYDGSSVTAHRLMHGTYANYEGGAVEWAEETVRDNADDPIGLFAWGIGNHGGGPSRRDLKELNQWMAEREDLQICHATPEEFFAAMEESGVECPEFADDLRPVFIGCYVSQARVKQLHRKLENRFYSAEKMAAAAAAQGLMKYPSEELAQAQYDMLLNEFHDTLPGTTIESGARGAEQSLNHGLEIADRVQMRAFTALLSGQPKAKPEWVPIFIYNPHPHPVSGVFSCEIMPAQHQNWQTDVQYKVNVYQDDERISSQQEKAEYNMNLDWRQKVSFYATLPPFSMSRFDCEVTYEPWNLKASELPQEDICFVNDRMEVVINRKTGLVDRYRVDGVDYLKPGSFATALYKDNADPWNMLMGRYDTKLGQFAPVPEKKGHRHDIRLNTPEIMIPAVRIVEDGPVRTIVEAEFYYGSSRLVQTYRLPKTGTAFEVEQRIYWNETDTMAKLCIPCAMTGDYIGQNMFGRGKLPQNGSETVSQKWCGIFGTENTLTVTNDGVYGSHANEDTMYLSLLRAPGYAAHPIEGRPLVREDRFIPRIDQGEHIFTFQICGGETVERRAQIEQEALVYNEKPFVINAFPGGEGKRIGSFVTVSDPQIVMTAMYCSDNKLILRLFNSSQEERTAQVAIPTLDICQTVTLRPSGFQTYIAEDKRLKETSPI
ncbi:MAG: alpha-mannosidase [Ruminococcaceae bacterium]|nr:alpha-mannosidase [Oscillospiraceae bacterium]